MQLDEELQDVDFVEQLLLDEQHETMLSETLQLEELEDIELFDELLLDDCADGGELLDLELLELALECELSDLDKEDEEQDKLGFLLEELLDDLVE